MKLIWKRRGFSPWIPEKVGLTKVSRNRSSRNGIKWIYTIYVVCVRRQLPVKMVVCLRKIDHNEHRKEDNNSGKLKPKKCLLNAQ